LFNILAAVSLVLFVATVASWVRSYWKYDDASHNSGVRQDRLGSCFNGKSFRSSHGLVDIEVDSARSSELPSFRPPRGWRFYSESREQEFGIPTYLGFGFYSHLYPARLPAHHGSNYAHELTMLVVPHWFLAMLSGFIPYIWITRAWRSRQ